MVICLERGADLHKAQLMPMPLTVSCFSKIQIGFTFLVPVHPGSPRRTGRVKRVCVCVVTIEQFLNCRHETNRWTDRHREMAALLIAIYGHDS